LSKIDKSWVNFLLMRNDLVPGQGRTWRWDPIVGKEYWLGYQHGRVAGAYMVDQQSTRAIYFGTVDGDRIFFQERGGRILRYAGSASLPALWYTDGDDEPGVPAVQAGFDSVVPEGKENTFIRERLAVIAERRKLEQRVA
jgi:hypothetical protein